MGEPTAAEMAAMEQQMSDNHFGIVRAEVLAGNIGYLKIDSFAPADFAGTQRAIVDALGFVSDAKTLILDVRDNHGGSGDTVALLMSYLLDSKRLLLNKDLFAASPTRPTKTGPARRCPGDATARRDRYGS